MARPWWLMPKEEKLSFLSKNVLGCKRVLDAALEEAEKHRACLEACEQRAVQLRQDLEAAEGVLEETRMKYWGVVTEATSAAPQEVCEVLLLELADLAASPHWSGAQVAEEARAMAEKLRSWGENKA